MLIAWWKSFLFILRELSQASPFFFFSLFLLFLLAFFFCVCVCVYIKNGTRRHRRARLYVWCYTGKKNGKQIQIWLIHFNPAGVSCSQVGRNVYLGIQNYTESQYGCWFYSPCCCYDKLLYQCWILSELIFLFRTNTESLWGFFSFGLCCFCLFACFPGSYWVCRGLSLLASVLEIGEFDLCYSTCFIFV